MLTRGGLLGLASVLPPAVLAACANDRGAAPAASGSTTSTTVVLMTGATSGAAASAPRSLTEHEARVVEEATARLIPGPADDPAEAGHPGAREAGVTRYIDTLLAALLLDTPDVYTGGPQSDRAGGATNHMAVPAPLTAGQQAAWVERLTRIRAQYTAGVLALDELAGGSFVDATAEERDAVLVKDPDGFTTLLFSHAIEGMYSAPEYGGNAGGVGWDEVHFAGDAQPNGYHGDAVSGSDGPDVYVREGIGDKLLTLISSTAIS